MRVFLARTGSAPPSATEAFDGVVSLSIVGEDWGIVGACEPSELRLDDDGRGAVRLRVVGGEAARDTARHPLAAALGSGACV